MALIQTKKQIQAYKKKIELQRELLPLSDIFTEEDKDAIASIYRDLIIICEKRLLSLASE
ncbi:hypothetical protein [Flavobacterium sp. I-STPA6A]|uniref:hypothetical protein n=1 Tax=Flavobacterium sp. I-STPA6A TaxID=2590450 RepID=UPI00131E0327|nr:hypothetical protein [Flavobacterium sp. I-STPA6A]